MKNLLWENSDPERGAQRETMSCLRNLSTILLEWGWKKVVGNWKWIVPRILHNDDQIEPVNYEHLSEFINEGTQKEVQPGQHELEKISVLELVYGKLLMWLWTLLH